MVRYIVTATLRACISLLVASVVVFVLTRATGDPVRVLMGPDPQQRNRWLGCARIWVSIVPFQSSTCGSSEVLCAGTSAARFPSGDLRLIW